MNDAEEVFAFSLTPMNEFGHWFPAALENARVAVCFPNCPWTDDTGIAPGGAEIPAMLKRKRRVAGECAAGPLRFHEFAEPLSVECGDIGVVGGGADVNLGVAGPTEAFVALGAIGWEIEEIGALGPNDIFEELPYHRIGAFEIACEGCIGVQDNSSDGVKVWLARKIGEFNVLETVESETRNVSLAVWIPAEDVKICGTSFAKIFGHKTAVGMEHFTVTEADHCTRWTFDFEASDAGKILAEIEDVNVGGRRSNCDGFDFVENTADGDTWKGLEFGRTMKA